MMKKMQETIADIQKNNWVVDYVRRMVRKKNGQDPNKLYSRDELYCLNENLLMEMANISRVGTLLQRNK